MSTNSFNPRFTNYDSLATYLTAQGSTFKKVLPLYTIGSDANDANIIGHWGYNSNNLIAPFGEIDLTKVTPSRFGTVASVSGSVITLTEGHNLPASFSGLQWDASAAAELFYGTPCTVAANVFTASNTAGIAAGDIVYDIQSSEFTIGGTTRNLRPKAGTRLVAFSGSGNGLYVENGKYSFHCGNVTKIYHSKNQFGLSFDTEFSASETVYLQRAAIGHWDEAQNIYHVGGPFRQTAAWVITAYSGNPSAPTYPTILADDCQAFNLKHIAVFLDYGNNVRYLYANGSKTTDTNRYRSLTALATVFTSSAIWGETVPASTESLSLKCRSFCAM